MNSSRIIHSKRNQLLVRCAALVAILASMSLSGCTAVLAPIDTIPASRVPPQFLAEPQASKVSIDVSRLRQNAPEFYTLDSGDTLAIFVEGVLGNFNEAPPVNLPDGLSDLPPAIGFPVPIREDGTISVPLVDPIPLKGLTIQQAEQLVTRAYREGKEPILKPKSRIIVTLLRKRTYRVFVVRQDNSRSQQGQQFLGRGQSGIVTDRSDFSSRGLVIQLPAYENDVLNALTRSGGLPGVNAKSEIRILRGDRLSIAARDKMVEDFYRSAQAGQFPYGQIPAIEDQSNVVRIPTRLKPGEVPGFLPEDIILKDGDIVYVDSRDTDVFYTGGLLGGREIPLPRDYDLDVFQAMALSGQSVAVGNQRAGSLVGVSGTVPPSELIILRRIPGRRQLAIRVDLNEAINNPRARLLVKAGDTLLLRFKPQEEFTNFVLSTFFTFGVRELFR